MTQPHDGDPAPKAPGTASSGEDTGWRPKVWDKSQSGSAAPTEGRCGRRLTHTGGDSGTAPRYCTQWPMRGRDCCKFHGGRNGRGLASPGFKHGRSSFYVPVRLRESYAEALADPEILSLKREIAHHRATSDLLRRRLDQADGAGEKLQSAWRDFKAAHRSGNPNRMADALTRVDEAMTVQAGEDAIREELRKETLLVSQLTQRENDRMEQLHQMVSREQALAYMRGLAVAVKESVEQHVADAVIRTTVLRAVSAKFEQLADRRGREDPDAGGQLPVLVGAAARD